ncbi:MAG TPA: MFS transporter [Rhizomicrobium sp.]|nr:MFS transporter [Rhizomicrobium sp.]
MNAVTGTFRSLRFFNYRLWFGGALVSNIGTWMQRTAQDWLVLTELTHHNATAVGIVMALQFGPQLLLLPWTGFAADHLDRRKLMMLTQAAMGFLALVLGIMTVTHVVQLWHVYVFAFLFGCVSAFDAPARQVFVSEMVDETHLANAVGLNSTSFNAGRMIGPAAAGLTIAAFGSGWAFILNGLSFVAVLVSLLFLRVHELQKHERAVKRRGSLFEGFIYVWHRPDLRAALIMLAFIGTFGFNFAIFISTMAVRVFHAGAGQYGLLSSAMAVGTMGGALLAAGREKPTFQLLCMGSGLFAIGCFFAAIMPDYWLFAAALVMCGVAALTFANTSNSLMQLSTEPAMRGRVMAIRLAIALGGTPIGAPIVGWIADMWGPRWSIGVAAASGVAATIVGMRYLVGQRSTAVQAAAE